VELFARPTLNIPTIAGLVGASVGVDLEVELASAQGVLTGVTCGAGTVANPESIDVHVTRSLVSAVNLSVPIHLTGNIRATTVVLNGLPFGLGNLIGALLNVLLGNSNATFDIIIQAGVQASTAPVEADATYAVPPHDYTDPERVTQAPSLVVPQVTITNADITGTVRVNNTTVNITSLLNLGQLTVAPIIADLIQKNVVRGINEFVDEVNAYLIPTLELLGASVAGADLYGVYRPVCNSPSLGG
jgi:hypothetical protein